MADATTTQWQAVSQAAKGKVLQVTEYTIRRLTVRKPTDATASAEGKGDKP